MPITLVSHATVKKMDMLLQQHGTTRAEVAWTCYSVPKTGNIDLVTATVTATTIAATIEMVAITVAMAITTMVITTTEIATMVIVAVVVIATATVTTTIVTTAITTVTTTIKPPTIVITKMKTIDKATNINIYIQYILEYIK